MNLNKSYLEYYKCILEKVSFDDELFRKEYRKALNILNDKEAEEFKKWASQQESLLN